jgi:hypothetical protein
MECNRIRVAQFIGGTKNKFVGGLLGLPFGRNPGAKPPMIRKHILGCSYKLPSIN